ncbi:MAG: sigma-70 family RNA polymerase sigma factor [Jatrophihabitans sp.]|uniref:sigma-70 family RNA polymerase sigma factor n=1 Tax=Jatrophihabitans sp. TaxID=1932789 RepID=UPI0039107699
MPPSEADFAQRTEPLRRELLAHCYRMLGSFHDAEDVVQETYLRAWRGFDDFEGRSSVRTWMYRIATRACLTALENKGRRVLPSGIGAPSDDPAGPLAERRSDVPWLQPLPDDAVRGDGEDPAMVAVRRESTRLAFVAALQGLPARQRAALILRDVLAFPAADVAELLEMTVAAVNSALQRARTQLQSSTPSEELVTMTPDVDVELLDRFISAFEAADMSALSGLFRDDVRLEMPPVPTWFDGRGAVLGFFTSRVLAGQRRRLVPTSANGCPAAATYVAGVDGRMRAHNIQVLEVRDGRVAHIYAFLDTEVFASFGLPLEWPLLT